MLLDVDERILDAEDHRPVITLLCMVAEKRHDWRPSLPQAVRMVEFVERLDQAGVRMPVLRQWAEEVVEESAYPSPPDTRGSIRVTLADLEHVVADLEKPAVLVVENQLADGSVVRDIAVALNERRIAEALRRTWLRLHHGGGAPQIVELAADEGKRFVVLPPRVAILLDGDRDGPGQEGLNDNKRADADAVGIRHVHILAYRSMENYVPLTVWECLFPRQRRSIERLRAMPAEQRGYLKKDAYPGKGLPRQLTVADRNLAEDDFRALAPDVVDELRRLFAMIHEIL
ncbi:hypothetical protein ACN27F_15145 [Solwaraspora sp. WMMB335]|uniref:hypothetical protein n=1 Tax=Solwaraspora sp. WMMB335 TaxID=3404118 RepID=UPI003B9273DD